MNENADIGPKPERDRQVANWIANNANVENVPEKIRESGPEIVEFENLVAQFESNHPIAELYAIAEISTILVEARKHPIREPARVALFEINRRLNLLRTETDISPEKYKEVRAKYGYISRAVGIVSNGKVDHDR